MVKKIFMILAVIVVLGFITGFYYKWVEDDQLIGNQIVGISVLTSVFILMPIFLYRRWRGKRLQDYTLTHEKMKKMQDDNKNRR
jgi:ABC-type bacteriocin/lantibiotic exporter with double-glycine peptidase domain